MISMVKARSIIEIVGGPKEYVDKAMGIVIKKLQDDEKITLLKEKVFEAKQIEGKPLFSCFCEVDIEVKDMVDLFGFGFDFMPSSLEIYDPTEFHVNARVMNEMFNELMAKMHQYDMVVKNIYAQNLVLKRKYGVLGEKKEEPKKEEPQKEGNKDKA